MNYNVLYPVKNRSISNLYGLLPNATNIDAIYILDSSDTPIDIIDLVAVFAACNVRVIYEYRPDLNLGQSRVHLLGHLKEGDLGLWLDSDVIIASIDLGQSIKHRLDEGAAFVCASVVNSRKLHDSYRGEYEFLKQFKDSPFNSFEAYTPDMVSGKDCLIAGMYCMAFKMPSCAEFFGFLEAMKETVPSEDLAFCRFMSLVTGKPGKIDTWSVVFHIGETNHKAWSFINYRRVEELFLGAKSYADLADLMAVMSAPEHVAALQHIYKSS